jgi:hypothetical protein
MNKTISKSIDPHVIRETLYWFRSKGISMDRRHRGAPNVGFVNQ